MTGIEANAAASLLKLGVTAFQRATPKGMAFIRSWWRGKEILVLGQARAGKSTFIDYFRFGLFEHEKDTAKTTDAKATSRFDIKLGRDAALELVVKNAFDYPGQWGPVKHADLAFEHRPHAIVIIADATSPIKGEAEKASGEWLREFCRRLETNWRSPGRKRNRLQAMVVVINKKDKVDDKKIAQCTQRFRAITEAELRDARGAMKDEIALMPCVLVTNPDEAKYVDSVIAHIAKLLAK